MLEILPELLVGHEAIVLRRHLDGVLHVKTPVLDAGHPLHVVDAHHEEVAQLEGRLLPLQVGLHLPIGVVDDGKEHVEKDKEDKEDVGEKVDGTKEWVSLLDDHKVEVSKDGSEEGIAGVDKVVEIFHLSSKQKETKLGKGKEYDEKHHGEPGEFLGALVEGP